MKLPDELVRQIQNSEQPIVSSYEDIVVHSDKLSNEMISSFAIEFIDSIGKFEEIVYLLSYLDLNTTNALCTRHMSKIDSNTNLDAFKDKVDKKIYIEMHSMQTRNME